ncbi:hypothetical protein EsDP_00001271 [Epichloe bromicola]|uniref:Aromatic amino acid beta-eliminating lyase/threonine aldolase domain-containing protein n=1 Tax=Epichloe bromicola TaxID=79588 RepID=A0ABQ0CHU4_9HYPO
MKPCPLLNPKVDRWGNPRLTGSASDFRSDAVTTPSHGMLEAISGATLNDDVYGEDQLTRCFEEHMASICGKEAALFVVSGTMANQVALGALSRRCTGVLADATSHIVHYEAGGLAGLSGASIQPVRPANGHYLTLEDVERHAVPTNLIERLPTSIISLENTAHGSVIPLQELRKMKAWADEQDIAIHIDGARIWHAVAGGGSTLKEIAACCDTMTLSFGKGLAAPVGSAIVGPRDLIARARRLRQSIGGGVRKSGPIVAAAWQAMIENFGPGDVDTRGIIQRTHVLAAAVGHMWTSRGGLLLRPVMTNLVWLDLKSAGIDKSSLDTAAQHRDIRVRAPRIVLHPQISNKAMQQLEAVFEEVLEKEASTSPLQSRAHRAALERL